MFNDSGIQRDSGLFSLKPSRNGGDAASGIRYKLKVYQRRLDRAVSQPTAEVVDRDAVQQIVPRIAVAQRVSADALACLEGAHLLGSPHSGLHPAPGSCRMRLDYPALPHASIRERARERRVKLRMDRHKPRLASLAGSDPECRVRCFQRQVPYFEIERLGHSQAGSPLLKHQELGLGVRGKSDDGVHLVGLKIFGKFLDALWSRAVLGLGIASARSAVSYNFSCCIGRQG